MVRSAERKDHLYVLCSVRCAFQILFCWVVFEVAVVGVFLQSRFGADLELLYMRLQVESTIFWHLVEHHSLTNSLSTRSITVLQRNKESTWVIHSEIGEGDSRKAIQMLSPSR